MRFHFDRFDAVEYPLSNVSIPWRYDRAQPFSSVAALTLLATWKLMYPVVRFAEARTAANAERGSAAPVQTADPGLVRRALARSILNVYLGVWLPKSDLRAQIVRMR